MATHSEHFEITKAAIDAAKADGFQVYVDVGEDEPWNCILNLFNQKTGKQLNFAEDYVKVEFI